MLTSALAVAALITIANAYPEGCHGGELVRRQRGDTEQSAAISTDPSAECTPYTYAPVTAMKSNYPTVWQTANLSQSGIDANAIILFNQINGSIPKIAVKGTPDGNFSSFTPTYSTSDPDCWWSYHQCTTPKISGLAADVTRCPTPMTWGFTLDDGPNCSHNAYYDYLMSQNQKATLFYIGSNVFDWPLEAQRGLSDGHTICAHTWSHRYMTALTNEQVFAELYFSKKAIKDVIGVTVQCWRPPFGDVDDRVRYIANALGMTTVIWSGDVNDFRIATVGQASINANYQDIIKAAGNGTYATEGIIVLSHEINNATMQTSENFLPQIQQAFKYVTPIEVCYNQTEPYLEGSSYQYPNFVEWQSGQRNGTRLAPSASANAAISLPISSGVTGSVLPTNDYQSPTATANVSTGAAHATGGGSGLSYVIGVVCTVGRFRLVCRSWNSLLNSHSFSQQCAEVLPKCPWFYTITHENVNNDAVYDPSLNKWYHLSLPLFPPKIIILPVTSAGGLVCFLDIGHRNFYVCNPLTQSFQELPSRSVRVWSRVAVGMILNPNGIGYKLLWLGCAGDYEVYDSVENAWTRPGNMPSDIKLPLALNYRSQAITIDSMIYFMRTNPDGLVSYDLVKSTWQQLVIPPPLYSMDHTLAECKGQIMLVGLLTKNAATCVCIWELQKMTLLWKEVDRMPNMMCLDFYGKQVRMICLGNKGSVLLSLRSRQLNRLVLYDMYKKSWHRVPSCVLPRGRKRQWIACGTSFQPSLNASV